MCQGAFQHDAGVNGVRGAPATEEEHWILCVGRPGGRAVKTPPSVDPSRCSRGPQRADGNSQRGRAAMPSGGVFFSRCVEIGAVKWW